MALTYEDKEKKREEAVKRGQALNLAVRKAVSDGKGDDFKTIAHNFLFYMQVSEILQKVDTETLVDIATNPAILEKLKDLKATLAKLE